MSSWLTVILLLAFPICAPASLPRIRVDVAGRFRDDQDRERIFHGFNRVNKGFPWYDATLLNKTRIDLYRKWGFNAARIGCMWSGVAPKRDMYNETYLNITMETVRLLEANGIYSLLDMHQDVISSRYGEYDGVPLWVINSFPNDSLPYPFPLTKAIIDNNWALGYLTMAVARAFQHLYDNTSAAIEHWGDFWVKVAQTFKSQTSVIGYELINEPFAGDFYHNIKVLLPGVAGRQNLLPTYDRLVARIRAVDNDTLVFYEPVTWGIYDGNNNNEGSGFSRVPGGPSQRTKSVLSYHYYCWLLTNQSNPYTIVQRVACDFLLMPTVFPAIKRDISRTGGGSFLTEFGLCEPDGNPDSENTQECEQVMAEADKYLQSWTYWDAVFFKADGNPNMKIVRAFSRAYPRAVAGNLTSLQFDAKTSVLQFSYNISTNISAPTEVFVPVSVHYPHGFDMAVSPRLKYSFDVKNSVILIGSASLDGASVRYGDRVEVMIKPRAKLADP